MHFTKGITEAYQLHPFFVVGVLFPDARHLRVGKQLPLLGGFLQKLMTSKNWKVPPTHHFEMLKTDIIEFMGDAIPTRHVEKNM